MRRREALRQISHLCKTQVRPTPVLLQTTCRVDLTALPIKVYLEAVPAILFKSLDSKIFTTDWLEKGKTTAKIIKRNGVTLIFEREVRDA